MTINSFSSFSFPKEQKSGLIRSRIRNRIKPQYISSVQILKKTQSLALPSWQSNLSLTQSNVGQQFFGSNVGWIPLSSNVGRPSTPSNVGKEFVYLETNHQQSEADQLESNESTGNSSSANSSSNGGMQTAIDGFGALDNKLKDQQDNPQDRASEADASETSLAISYCRVSAEEKSDDDEDDRESLATQEENNRETAEALDLEIIQHIKDDGESGQDFKRPGIRELQELVKQHDVEYVIIDHISRLGRCAPETLNFIQKLRDRHDVKLVFNRRVLDIDQPDDRMGLMFRTMVADVEVQYQSRKAQETSKRRFENKQKWTSWFPNIPRGYKSDGDGWIEKKDDWEQIIEETHDIFQTIEYSQPYADTAEKISQKFDVEFDNDDVKEIVTRPVYAGRPTGYYDIRQGLSDEDAFTTRDEELQFVELDVFERSRTKVLTNLKRHQYGQGKNDVEGLIVEFGLDDVMEQIECVEVVCDKCGEPMVKNGSKAGKNRHIYLCEDCPETEHSKNNTRLIPHADEIEALRGEKR